VYVHALPNADSAVASSLMIDNSMKTQKLSLTVEREANAAGIIQ